MSPIGEPGQAPGTRLRLARQARGLSQQQLAGMAGVTRQGVSAVESGHSDPSLRVALALAGALGVTVEQLFGPGDPAEPVLARPVAPLGGAGARVALAAVGDVFVALPQRAGTVSHAGFRPAGGLVADTPATLATAATPPAPAPPALVAVRPIGPPRPTLVVAGCDPALPLLETPLALTDPPVAFAWWPCGSAEALRLAAEGLVHAAGVHRPDRPRAEPHRPGPEPHRAVPDGAELVGFTAWREGLAHRPDTAIESLGDAVRQRLRLVNREPGAQARTLLDGELARLGVDGGEMPGYDTRAAGHLQVAAAVAGRLADVGVTSEPAALAHGLAFIPLAAERFDLVLPAKQAASREVQSLRKVLASPWLLAQLASLPGYDLSGCGEQL